MSLVTFANIDNFLILHSPSWYRTPRTQTIILGIIFFWVFAAYTTIQFFAKSTYGSSLAANSVSAVYLTFTLSCLIAPSLINKYGCRLCMMMGTLGYASLVLTSLIYFLYGGEDVQWTRRLVVMGGAILGCGASILWTAQGRLILQYAARAEEIIDASSTNEDVRSKSQTGKLMGLFWGIFQTSSLVGGIISFMYYNRKPEGSTALYLLFLAFILFGALCTQLLLPPSILQLKPNAKATATLNTQQKDLEMVTEHTPLTTGRSESTEGQSQTAKTRIDEDLSHQSWQQEAWETLELVSNKKILLLTPLFFYTGYNQPYQQATFGNRFFTRRTIGAELIIFHLMEILGAIVCGRLLDSERKSTSCINSRRNRAILCLLSFLVIDFIGNVLAAAQEVSTKQSGGYAVAHDIASFTALSPSLAFACWGFAE